MGAGLSSKVPENPDYTLEVQMQASIPVEQVILAAQAAGQAIVNVYNSETSKWEVELKSDSSPLTRADKEANRIICEELTRIAPHVPIISEENNLLPFAVREKFQYHWLVDPLDGTKEFLKRNGEFTVNIALICKDKPVLGVVHVPVSGHTYWAVQGKGSWLRKGAQQERIQCSEFGMQDSSLKIVASSSHLSKETEEFIGLFSNPEFMQVGSSLKLLMVAEGTAHIYPRLLVAVGGKRIAISNSMGFRAADSEPDKVRCHYRLAPTCEWDTAAADIIVREAGGITLQAGACDDKGNALEDWKDALMKEQPLMYNKEKVLNPFFIVWGKRRDGPDAPSA